MTILAIHSSLWDTMLCVIESKNNYRVLQDSLYFPNKNPFCKSSEINNLVDTTDITDTIKSLLHDKPSSPYPNQISFYEQQLEQLMKDSVFKSNITAISVTYGPGSYTGIRLGISLAYGLAYGCDCPIIGINNHHVLKHCIEHQFHKAYWVFTETRRMDFVGSLVVAKEDSIQCSSYTKDQTFHHLQDKGGIIWKQQPIEQDHLESYRMYDMPQFISSFVSLSCQAYDDQYFPELVPLYVAPIMI